MAEGVSTFFQTVLKNVQLSAPAYLDASGKHGRVRRCLNRSYYGSESESANSFLVGSYGKNTEITPPSDIDILFELPASVYDRCRLRTGNVQSQLLQEVKRILEAVSPSTTMKADGQVVLVPFTTYAVEVLPAFRLPDGTFRHADTNDGGRWRVTNPRAEQVALTDSNARTGKTIHLIKLAKAWKVACNVKVKSLVLELAAVEFLANWAYTRSSEGRPTGMVYYDWMLRDFFTWLGNQTNRHWYLPGVYDTVWTGDAWAAQARFAANAASRACEHHAGDRPYSAASEWANIFGAYAR